MPVCVHSPAARAVLEALQSRLEQWASQLGEAPACTSADSMSRWEEVGGCLFPADLRLHLLSRVELLPTRSPWPA